MLCQLKCGRMQKLLQSLQGPTVGQKECILPVSRFATNFYVIAKLLDTHEMQAESHYHKVFPHHIVKLF